MEDLEFIENQVYLKMQNMKDYMKTGEEVCEHVSFNYAIRNNQGKIFIHPNLIIGPKILPFLITKFVF